MRYVRAELRKLVTLPSVQLTAVLIVAATALLRWVDAEPVPYTQAGFLVIGAFLAVDSLTASVLAMPRRLTLHVARALTLVFAILPLATVAGSPVYLTATTVLGFAVASVVRQSLAAVLTLLGSHFVAGPVLRAASADVAAFLPDRAAWDPATTSLTTAVAWAAAALTVSTYCFVRRDAT